MGWWLGGWRGAVRELGLLVRMLWAGEEHCPARPLSPWTPLSLLPLQLLWSADADRKQQCSFKGKDPKVRLEESEGSGQNTEQTQPSVTERV